MKYLIATVAFGIVVAASDFRAVQAQPADTNYDESKVPKYILPNPLISSDGQAISSDRQWLEQRRPEILKLFEQAVYGKAPTNELKSIRYQVHELDADALQGQATRKQVSIYFTDNDQPRMDLLIYIPNHVKQQVPCFLGLNFYGNQTIHSDPAIQINPNWMRGNAGIGIVDNRATEQTRGVYSSRWQAEMIIRRGYALATIYYGDIDPDNYSDDFSDGVHPLFYVQGQTKPEDDQWGAIGAWAWGLSRALDYLKGEDRIDHQRVAVLGHSRLGKTALWAGATDPRFALVISNNSGCGGAALYRRCFGERVHHMTGGAIGYWFCRNHKQFAHRESELPVDQHMLIALMAPRPVYVASATQDKWADPKGEFLSAKHASEVYRLFGHDGLEGVDMPPPNRPIHARIGYHLRDGQHDVTKYDWQQYLDFADKHLPSK